jgi:hypothetical protein
MLPSRGGCKKPIDRRGRHTAEADWMEKQLPIQ